MAKTINVVGAAIVRDGKVLCAQRGEPRALAGKWEFPGGKIEEGESPEAALVRELREELKCEVDVTGFVCTTPQEYDFGTVVLSTYLCSLVSGEPQLTEHQQTRWLAPEQMPELDWAPADLEAVGIISGMSLGADRPDAN